MIRKPRIHSILHLSDVIDFGPTTVYNEERLECRNDSCTIVSTLLLSYRCESYKGIIRQFNLHANRKAPSRDITKKPTTAEHLQLLFSGGTAVVEEHSVQNFWYYTKGNVFVAVDVTNQYVLNFHP